MLGYGPKKAEIANMNVEMEMNDVKDLTKVAEDEKAADLANGIDMTIDEVLESHELWKLDQADIERTEAAKAKKRAERAAAETLDRKERRAELDENPYSISGPGRVRKAAIKALKTMGGKRKKLRNNKRTKKHKRTKKYKRTTQHKKSRRYKN